MDIVGAVVLEWQTGVAVPLFKKGGHSVCSNYQGITLQPPWIGIFQCYGEVEPAMWFLS